VTPRAKQIVIAKLQKASAELAEAFKMVGTDNSDPGVVAAILKAKKATADATLAITGGNKMTLGELLSAGADRSSATFPLPRR
jgi:hypothetical protein